MTEQADLTPLAELAIDEETSPGRRRTRPIPRVMDLHALPGLAFGMEARRLRRAAHMSQEHLADLVHYTGAMVSYVESAQRIPPADLVASYEEIFKTDGMLSRLGALVRRFGKPRMPLSRLLQDATSLRLADPLVVPPLLQTDDYARVLLRGARVTREECERLLAERPRLSELFGASPEPHAWLVIDESTLHRAVGGQLTLRAQLKELLVLAESGRLMIQVLPATSSAIGLLRVPFVLLTFDEGADVAVLPGACLTDPIERYGDAAWHAHHFDLLRAAALSPEDSLPTLWRATRR